MLHPRGVQSSFASTRLPEFVVIEFPGIIKNTDKALEALGGLQNINSVRLTNNFREIIAFFDTASPSPLKKKVCLVKWLVRGAFFLIHPNFSASFIWQINGAKTSTRKYLCKLLEFREEYRRKGIFW